MKKAIAGLAILCLMVQGCASGKNERRSGTFFSSADAQELAIGEQIHSTILQSFYPYTEPKLVGYVNNLGHSLAGQSGRRDLNYRFTILYSDKIYAASAPGGFVYVTTGMMHFLENESQLAGVLAHEIGELQFRDPQIATNGRKMMGAAAKGGAMVGPAFGMIGALAALGLVAVSQVSQPRQMMPEDKLIRADENAMNYMLNAGQDPQGLIDVFYKILKADGEVIPYFYDYYQSRPITEGRMMALNETFSKLPMQGQSFHTNREVYQEVTKGIREMYKAS